MLRIGKSEKFWDNRAKEYEKKEIKWEKIYNKAVEETKQYLNSNDIVLDYACGTGIITAQVAGYVKEIQAIDISSKMIDIAKRITNDRQIKNINFAQATIFEESFEKESFNVILAFNVLHLLEDTEKVIQRINELLKPGGLFISETACMREKKSFLSIFLFFLSKIRVVPYIRFLKFSELESLIVNEKFQIVESRNLDQTSPTYYVVAKKS
ncbi:Ubiquinone biosynthesis O-methyltransferase, mitochondrial [subsurface metagenome]